MRLYYFTSQSHGLASIRDQRLKISRFKELNDPFDFIGIATKSPAERQAVKKIRDRVGSKGGVICMSKNWSEPLLWGHYADKHKGICLSFQVDEKLWEEVKYVDERPSLEHYGVSDIDSLTSAHLKEISLTKFTKWSYEKEWRRFVTLGQSDFVDTNHFLSFGPRMELEGVMFGERSTVTKEQIKGIAHSFPKIKMGFARAAFSDFKVVPSRLLTSRMIPKKNRIRVEKGSDDG